MERYEEIEKSLKKKFRNNIWCRFTENCMLPDNEGGGSKRQEMKTLLKKFRQTSPFIESNIFKSVENVNLNTIIAYKKDGLKHHFLDDYDNKINE